MRNIAIKVENLSKAYQLGEIGTGTISRDVERWFAKVRGKEDPFLRIGETNDRTSKGSCDIVWSLKDINFEIEQGDAVGIIGRNGAGKSTLLKIISRITSPTSGSIQGKGRIASLLEVGTGFHPELTGRENIFLNGAILGMRKREIQRQFDEIVDFAGVERYVDTPVKRYSSGMYVRLAFAVAAHLESEILIVDEVLAVGDAEFQKKCLGKMGEVSKGHGRTILFVSHNMAAIKAFCNTSILLAHGKIHSFGKTSDVVSNYNSSFYIKNKDFRHKVKPTIFEITHVSLDTNSFKFDDTFRISIRIRAIAQRVERKIQFFILIYDSSGDCIAASFQEDNGNYFIGKNDLQVAFNAKNTLYPGIYSISVGIFDSGRQFLDWIEDEVKIEVQKVYADNLVFKERLGKVRIDGLWSTEG